MVTAAEDAMSEISPPESASKPPQVLSCTACRERKTKCDKTPPVCRPCARSHLACVWPSRKKTRRVPRLRQRELLDRISRLESIVADADPDKSRQQNDGDADAADHDDDAMAPHRIAKSSTSGLVAERGGDPVSAPVIASVEGSAALPTSPIPRSNSAGATAKYLSAEFWNNLCVEVDGIKHALDQPSEEENDEDEDDVEDDNPSGYTPESSDTVSSTPSWTPASAFIARTKAASSQQNLLHPAVDTRAWLWAIWSQNCDPLIKILHRPTVHRQLAELDISESTPAPSPARNALFFNIYFAAISSMTPEACVARFGKTRDALLKKYWPAAEHSLAAADYLNSTELETLQAFAIYITMIRCHSTDRSAWALVSLLVRLGQALDLHRDGDGSRFTPFEAETRRRLWYYIIILDIRASEDRGSDAIISPSAYDTSPPTALNDDDMFPESTRPFTPRIGPTDAVLFLCITMCSGLFGSLLHPTPSFDETRPDALSEDHVIAHVRRLENTFIHTAHSSHLPSGLAALIARTVILKLWLVIQYPYFVAPLQRPRATPESVLRTATSLLEVTEKILQPPYAERFSWWNLTYNQWHPLAVALAELCVQTRGPLVERAWQVVDRMLPLWRDKIADSHKGALWRPIRKLVKKARVARSEAMMQDMGLNEAPTTDESLFRAEPQAARDPVIFNPGLVQAVMQPDEQHHPVPQQDFQYVQIDGAEAAVQNYGQFADPSYLFEYHSELFVPEVVGGGEPSLAVGVSPWTEFLQDTQMFGVPGAGGDGAWR